MPSNPADSTHYGPAVPPGDPEAFNVLALINVLMRRWKLTMGVPAVLIALAVVTALIGTRYQAQSKFVPQTAQNRIGGLGALAAQFGVNLNFSGGGGGESSDFYQQLLKSRELLTEAVTTQYHVAAGESLSDTMSGTLVELFKVGGETEEERQRHAMDRLEHEITVSVDAPSNVITLRTYAEWPQLAIAINTRLLDLMNQFNIQKRRSQAKAEREFLEARMGESRSELEAAEDRLARFMEKNKQYQDSPELNNEANRLQRRVDMNQQVFTSLAQAYEQARVDEVRNTPVLTIMDHPAARRKRGLLLRAGLAAVVGTIIGGGLAMAAEYFARQRATHSSEYEEFSTLMGRLGRKRSSRTA